MTQLAIGPGQSFGEETLENFPTITRDIRDFIRLDPRVSISRADEVDRISCLGGNDRANTFTIDGIPQSDAFGLNGNAFASRNSSPIPFDTIREVSVEFAPFDVQYGNFTGCAINAVTKSGQNQFHGTAFFTYTGSGLQGDEIDGQPLNFAPFDRYRWGATLGGPIIPDRLFFYAGYEETDLSDAQEDGIIGAGLANTLNFANVDQFKPLLPDPERPLRVRDGRHRHRAAAVRPPLLRPGRRALGRDPAAGADLSAARGVERRAGRFRPDAVHGPEHLRR